MKIFHIVVLSFLTIVMSATMLWIVMNSLDYYTLTLLERPHHPAHGLWKPGGNIGHGLGIIGTLMVLLMLGYSLRKRLKVLKGVGRLRTWLNYHIFLGIAGPILVTFHTAFKFGGLVSVSYWSMVAVALSGFVGRYLYVKVPRKLSGEELSRRDLEKAHKTLSTQLSKEYTLSDSTLSLISEIATTRRSSKKGYVVFFNLIAFDITSRYRINKLCKTLIYEHEVPIERLREFKRLLMKIIATEHKIAFLSAATRLFHHWHVVHKPFAYTMISIMIIHLITTITFGFTWIF